MPTEDGQIIETVRRYGIAMRAFERAQSVFMDAGGFTARSDISGLRSAMEQAYKAERVRWEALVAVASNLALTGLPGGLPDAHAPEAGL